MRLVKRSPWLTSLGVLLLGVGMVGGAARAEVTMDSAGSIIVYPKIVSDGTRDTLIQMSNTSNSTAFVHCFYVNTLGQCSSTTAQSCRLDGDCPDTELCVRECNAGNFDIILTAQQPTHWRLSTGRLASMTPGPCRPGQTCQCTGNPQTCPGLEVAANNQAFAPGVGTAFEGELKCYQTDQTQTFPISGNALKGTATIETLASGQISEYNALTITSNGDLVNGVNNNQDLRLNNPAGGNVGEYNYCPRNLVFTHHGEGAVDPVTNATISTEITVVPCSELIEEDLAVPAIVGFVGFNEFEQRLSVDGVNFDCYFSRRLTDIPSEGQGVFVAAAGNFWKMRVTPSSSNICWTGTRRGLTCSTADADPVTGCPGFSVSPAGVGLGCLPATGVLGVVEEFHSILGQPDGTAAYNVHVEGERTGFGDIITTPLLQ
jgi:hypothetical protein